MELISHVVCFVFTIVVVVIGGEILFAVAYLSGRILYHFTKRVEKIIDDRLKFLKRASKI